MSTEVQYYQLIYRCLDVFICKYKVNYSILDCRKCNQVAEIHMNELDSLKLLMGWWSNWRQYKYLEFHMSKIYIAVGIYLHVWMATNLWIFRKWLLCQWVDIIRSDDLGDGNYYVVDTAGIQAWLHCAFGPLLSRRKRREAAIRLHWHMVLVWPVRWERHACANWWWRWWCQQGNI